MNRRHFLRLGAATAAALALPDPLPGAAAARRPAPLPELETFNYVIGAQSIGATYQFTGESLMVETARATLELGSNVFKLAMGRDYRRLMPPSKTAYPETMQFLLNQGADARKKLRRPFPEAALTPPPADPSIRCLTDLARREPSYRQVFEMPFAHYLIWTYAFTPRWWHQGFPAREQKKEYRELYDLAAYLLKTFDGSGKTFYLGHWEGDWHLRPELNLQSDASLTPEMLQGMADWLNTRQRAVEDARRKIPHRHVRVFCYAEANQVATIARAGRPSVAHSVLPQTNMDFVSYSTYDALGDIPGLIPQALDYLAARLQPKPGLEGKRVFIGEYGFAARTFPEPDRVRRSREIMRLGLEWGCPFVLSWALYNNEHKDNQDTGYWLVDNRGTRLPLWHTHHEFLVRARQAVRDFHTRHARLPTADEYRPLALAVLKELPA